MAVVVIGLDIGTTSISCVAIRGDGALVTSVTQPHSAVRESQPVNCAEQDPDHVWQAVVRVLNRIMADCRNCEVAAIGLTGQMHSTLLLNRSDEVLGNIITWQDKRALTIGPSGVSILDQLLERSSEEDMQCTGCRLAPGFMGTTLFALQQLSALPSELHRVSFVADWIGASLTGQSAITDRSHAASSGLYDLAADCWSAPLLAAANVNPGWLPEVSDSGCSAGHVIESAARETGLPAGTLVCNAIGDNQAAVLSSLPHSPHSLLINIGTGGQIVWRIPDFQRVAGMETRYLPGMGIENSGGFMLVGAGLCGGDSLAWINRTVRSWLAAFGCQRSEEEVWEQLTADLAAELQGDSSLRCEPFFAGTRTDPDRRGVFLGVGTDNFTPAEIARSILFGIADTMHTVYQGAAGHRPEPLHQICMSGNGARQNPLLVSSVADRFGVSVAVSPCREEAATGAAMLAGVSAGCWPNLNTAQLLIHDAAQ